MSQFFSNTISSIHFLTKTVRNEITFNQYRDKTNRVRKNVASFAQWSQLKVFKSLKQKWRADRTIVLPNVFTDKKQLFCCLLRLRRKLFLNWKKYHLFSHTKRIKYFVIKCIAFVLFLDHCTGNCTTDFLCAMVHLKTEEMRKCQNGEMNLFDEASISPKSKVVKRTLNEEIGVEVIDDLSDWEKRKLIRQQLASKVISYLIVAAVLILILVYTRHLVDMCRNNSYFRLPD